MAQTVVRMYLEPDVEPLFHPDSYGYRPGRSALDAVGQCRMQVLGDAQRRVSELYAWLFGKEGRRPLMDERLADINITSPEQVDDLLAALFGAEDAA